MSAEPTKYGKMGKFNSIYIYGDLAKCTETVHAHIIWNSFWTFDLAIEIKLRFA